MNAPRVILQLTQTDVYAIINNAGEPAVNQNTDGGHKYDI